MERPDFTVPLIRTRQGILASGIGDNEIRRAVRTGTLVRLRAGCYVDGPLDDKDLRASLGARVGAVGVRLGDSGVFSHATAADLWGLPFLGEPPDTTHVTVPRTAHGVRRAKVHQHTGSLVPEEIVALGGIRLTTVPRTLVDVARTEGFRAGVVMADCALRRCPDPEGLRRAMEASIRRLTGAVGIGQARRVAGFAVAEAESPGESLSRVIFNEQGVPAPQLQFPLVLRMPGGWTQHCRTDFAWERQRLVGEFDGKAKYERYVRRGESPGDVVFREKRREDALRAAGWRVLRWTWEELGDPATLGRRVRDALAEDG